MIDVLAPSVTAGRHRATGKSRGCISIRVKVSVGIEVRVSNIVRYSLGSWSDLARMWPSPGPPPAISGQSVKLVLTQETVSQSRS